MLLRGENGTGKGVLARALHAWGKRPDGPFVTVQLPEPQPRPPGERPLRPRPRRRSPAPCATPPARWPPPRGGPSSSTRSATCPLALQPKLLRFLQERKFERVGEARTRSADVRLVAATNRDLEAALASGAFREDLLYRLNVVELTMPPLRLRSDVLDLAGHLLAFFARQTGRRIDGFTAEAGAALRRHAWPGNIRELRNAVERAAILADGPEIGVADLPERIATAGGPGGGLVELGGPVSLASLEAEHIRRILAVTPGRDEAARVLGSTPAPSTASASNSGSDPTDSRSAGLAVHLARRGSRGDPLVVRAILSQVSIVNKLATNPQAPARRMLCPHG